MAELLMPEAAELNEKVKAKLDDILRPHGYRCTGVEYFDYGLTLAAGAQSAEQGGRRVALLYRLGGRLAEPDYDELARRLMKAVS